MAIRYFDGGGGGGDEPSSNEGFEHPEHNIESGNAGPPERPDDISPDSSGYDDRVKERFNEYVEKAKSEMPDGDPKDILDKAYKLIDDARKTPEGVSDNFLRDVEHYAVGFVASYKGDLVMESLVALGEFPYDLLKGAAIGLKNVGFPKMEKWLRSDDRFPLTEPGYRMDGFRGLIDGFDSRGKKIIDRKKEAIVPRP
jgi:hypothetical protein